MPITRRLALMGAIASLAACGRNDREASRGGFDPPLYPNETPELRRLIDQFADTYEVQIPRDLKAQSEEALAKLAAKPKPAK